MIGNKIRELRKYNELTQKEFAEEIGVSLSSVQNWEKGIAEPSIFNCIVMADYFDVTLDELCGRCKK